MGRTLLDVYRAYVSTPHDIHEHLPLLYYLASQCDHVTEFGTRRGASTSAFLAAQPRKLVCYDVVRHPEVDELEALHGVTEFVFRLEDVLYAPQIEDTDMLFIDTLHTENQLRAELSRHAEKVRKWIVLHDTETFGRHGEVGGLRGLRYALDTFLPEGKWMQLFHLPNCNGLTVLTRRACVLVP